jgi:broad specificity phosphatase PhoE
MAYTPDWALPLTEKGKEEARELGKKIRKYVNNQDRVRFYVSPYRRAQETYGEIVKQFNQDGIQSDVREEVRLREMDWANFQDPVQMKEIKAERIRYGTFFYRVPNGEAGSDVYDRVSMFFESLFRSMQRNYPNQPTVLILCTHGLLARFFIMRWFHFSVEEYETWRNLKNCEFYLMERQAHERTYTLTIGPLPRDDDPDTKQKDEERFKIANKKMTERRKSVVEFPPHKSEQRSRTPSPFRAHHNLPEALKQTLISAANVAEEINEGVHELPVDVDQNAFNSLENQ